MLRSWGRRSPEDQCERSDVERCRPELSEEKGKFTPSSILGLFDEPSAEVKEVRRFESLEDGSCEYGSCWS